MKNLLQISPGFWNIDGSLAETSYLEKIKNGEEQNDHVTPLMVHNWQTPEEDIESDNVEALLKLVAKNVDSCDLYPLDMTLKLMKYDAKNFEEAADFMKVRLSIRFILMAFRDDSVWCFLIFDAISQTCHYSTTSKELSVRILSTTLQFNRIVRNLTGIVIPLTRYPLTLPDLMNSRARHSMIWGFLGVLKYFDRLDTSDEINLEFTSNGLMLYEVRLLYALARQSWQKDAPEAPTVNVVQQVNPPQVVFNSDLFLPSQSDVFQSLNMDFLDVRPNNDMLELPELDEPNIENINEMVSSLQIAPPDAVVKGTEAVVMNDLQKLKEQHEPDIVVLYRVKKIDTTVLWKDAIVHPIVAAVAYLTANAASCGRDDIILFLTKHFGLEKQHVLPSLTGIFLMPGNIDDTPLETRPIVQLKDRYYLTQYGFDTYIKNCSIIQGYISKMDEKNGILRPYRYANKKRGRKTQQTKRITFLEGPQTKRKKTATWIGIVYTALRELRRPVSVHDMAQYLLTAPHISTLEEIRENFKELKTRVRQAFKQGETASGNKSNDIGNIKLRAQREQVFYRLKATDSGYRQYGLLDNTKQPLYANRVGHSPYDTRYFCWQQLCVTQPLFIGWVLQTEAISEVFDVGEKYVKTKFFLPQNLLIYCRNPSNASWFMYKSRYGSNIQFVKFGLRFYAELQCDFPAGAELNFNPTIPE
jgi:hypothetical protein